MLVLRRHTDEQIMVGDLVRITVVEIQPDAVRIGFEAPKEVVIHRREVWEAIEREKQGGENDGK
jgi:carbon storage regulator